MSARLRGSNERRTQSEAFAKGHRQGSLAGGLQGPPVIGLYESVLVETA